MSNEHDITESGSSAREDGGVLQVSRANKIGMIVVGCAKCGARLGEVLRVCPECGGVPISPGYSGALPRNVRLLYLLLCVLLALSGVSMLAMCVSMIEILFRPRGWSMPRRQWAIMLLDFSPLLMMGAMQVYAGTLMWRHQRTGKRWMRRHRWVLPGIFVVLIVAEVYWAGRLGWLML